MSAEERRRVGREALRLSRLIVVVVVALLGLSAFAGLARAADIPRQALAYRNDLIRDARFVWGLSAPVATFGAQIHQESGWRPDARSKFAGGLAQFTPDTAIWIGSLYKNELGGSDPFNPSWAMRALVRYDRHLFDRLDAPVPCDRWALTLSAYNGGLGWVIRDQRLAELVGDDPKRWWDHVERHSHRADWAIKENRAYPRRILLDLQPIYLRWGAGVPCRR